jgi:o-succinylbenzoate---CoA ligase
MKYPYDIITMNGRAVSIDDICSQRETGLDDFEVSTFSFIRKWKTDAQHFDIFTSGSTGPAKKITFTRDQMMASARLTAQALDLKAGYTALVCLDTRFIAGQMMLVRSFTTGMHIVAVTPSANPFSELVSPVDFAALVPYQVYHILETPEARFFNSIGTIIVGGAALDDTICTRLQQFNTAFYATYGMTETISHVGLQKINGPDATAYFTPLPGISTETDHRDCLILTVPFLKEKIITNDLVELKGSGQFIWLGRWDNVLNSGGVKIIPERVEDQIRIVFREMNFDQKFFLSAVPDVQFGDKIVLFVEGTPFTLQDQRSLREALSKALSPYEIPKEVIILKSFEMTQSGKLNRYSTRQNIDKSLQKFTLKK